MSGFRNFFGFAKEKVALNFVILLFFFFSTKLLSEPQSCTCERSEVTFWFELSSRPDHKLLFTDMPCTGMGHIQLILQMGKIAAV